MEISKVQGVFPHATPNDELLLQRIATERAVLFIGSGFARGTTNLFDTPMPIASSLANQLAEIGGYPKDDDLRYISDRFITDGDISQLITHLKKTFTVKSTAICHEQIAKVNWRRIYTTNYDLTFERASANIGNLVEPVGVDCEPASVLNKKNVCVHLNGQIDALDQDSLNSHFKLSNSSYISPDSFLTSRWNYPFRRDLERAAAVVFVGYSMYDIEIQKLLYENQSLKEKTYFVVAPNPNEKERIILSKFGEILDCGTEGFGALCEQRLPEFVETATPVYTTAFYRYRPSESREEFRDFDVERFLMHGDISPHWFDEAVAGVELLPFLISRHQMKEIRTTLEDGNHCVVTADFGDGKTVAASVLAATLAKDGLEVYELDDVDDDYIGDYEKLLKSGGTKYLLIDGYDKCIDLIEHHVNYGSPDIRLVLFSRTSDHERSKGQLSRWGFSYSEIGIDTITREESEQFVDIIDNVGMWGKDAALGRERKINKVAQDGAGHISQTLLALFEAPQMKSRLTTMLAPLLEVESYRSTIFAISLLEYLSLPLHSSLISRVALNDAIYSSELRKTDSFQSLYHARGNEIRSKSSVFALVLIRNNFPASYIVENALRFAASVVDDRGEPRTIQIVFKSLLRFSLIERLLPSKNRKDNLVRYYEQLKRNVRWLASEPHYWVQYAMALLTYSEFNRAQGLLDQAYAIAGKRHNYHTDNIDTQQARLYFLRCLDESDAKASFEYFKDGDTFLNKIPNDMGKLRQIGRYNEIYRAKYPNFSKKQKVHFEHACNALITDIERAKSIGDLSSRADVLAVSLLGSLSHITSQIKADRD